MRCVRPRLWHVDSSNATLHKQLGRRTFTRKITSPRRLIGKLCELHSISQPRPYKYSPLQTGEIRLLEIHPGQRLDRVRCTLRHVALSDKPIYESLSYCWGTSREEAAVHCGLDHIPVTRNLFTALQSLRHVNNPRTLWIDALSIDQRNIQERGEQVGMMRDIFQRSERTVIWLGPAAENSSRAVQLIRQLADASKGPAVKSDALPPLYDSCWGAFAHLLKRQWWHRAWIVQEASVATEIVFLCGSDIFTWNDIERAVHHAVELGFFVASEGSATFQALSLFQTRTSFQSEKRPPLHHVLLQHRSSRAKDPRDKVYGLLALADQKDVAAMAVHADYSRSSDELFTSISSSLLESGNLGAFKAAGIRLHASSAKLPSWVADWSVSDSTVPFDTPISQHDRSKRSHTASTTPRFSASGSSACSAVFSNDHTKLKLRGYIVDHVEAVGVLSRTRYLRHVSPLFELFVQCYDILLQLADWEKVARTRSHKPYPTGESVRDTWWMTLYAGRVPPYLRSQHHDSRYKYSIILRLLRTIVRATIPWFPRATRPTWYNRFFFMALQNAWRLLGLTPTKRQRIGFPPESRLPNGRRMVRTEKEYIALAPKLVREGDCIAICEGGRLPLVVRKEGECWILVGESYVHGIMKGEAWVESKCEDMWFK